jgi:hypothetical protein
VIEAGGHAVHVPYAITWVHERVPDEALGDAHYHEILELKDLAALLRRLSASGPRTSASANEASDGEWPTTSS